MTKSNETDPWLKSESSEDSTKSPENRDPESKPKWLISAGDEEDSPNETSDSTTSDQAEGEGSHEDATELSTQPVGDEFVPTEIKPVERSGFTRQSEATFVPSKPRLYRAPGNTDEDSLDEQPFGDEPPADTQRLFIAVELPRKRKREFRALADSFRPREHERVRWIEEEAMHLTLKFLGDVPIDQIDAVKAQLKPAADATGSFTGKIGRTGCFPSVRDPRICWVGLSGELRRLEQLQGRVEGRMTALGFSEEERKFRAHVTVGRTRAGIRGRFAEDVGVSWQHAPLKSTGQSIPVNAIALYRSLLDPKGNAEYQQLANFELG